MGRQDIFPLAVLGIIFCVALVALATTINVHRAGTAGVETPVGGNTYGLATQTVTLSPTRTLFRFRWDDRSDTDRRQIHHAAIADGQLMLVGACAGGHQDSHGEGIWNVQLSDGTITARELCLDGGSQYKCPLQHGLTHTALSAGESGIVVSIATNGNVECTQGFASGDPGPRGFVSYTAPLQRGGLLATFNGSAELDYSDEFAVAGGHVLIHPEKRQYSKLYTFPGLAFVTNVQEIVPVGAVGEYIVGYSAADMEAMRMAQDGMVQYSAFRVQGGALQKVADLPGVAEGKQGGRLTDKPMVFVRDSTDPSRAAIQTARGRIISLQAGPTAVQVQQIGTGPVRTVSSQYQGVVSVPTMRLLGAGGDQFIFGDIVSGENAYGPIRFAIWRGTQEVASGQMPRERPIWQTTQPHYPNVPVAAFFSGGKLIVVGSHGAYEFSPGSGACGNGVLEGGEQCDSGQSNGACPQACSSTCTVNSCGSGYAPQVDPVDGQQYLTLSATRTGTTATVSVTGTADGRYIYKAAYFLNGSGQWQQFTFPQAAVGQTNWISTQASATLTGLPTEGYVIIYACKKYSQSGQWVCGAAANPPNPSDRRWTIASYNVSAQGSSTPGGNSSGSNCDQCVAGQKRCGTFATGATGSSGDHLQTCVVNPATGCRQWILTSCQNNVCSSNDCSATPPEPGAQNLRIKDIRLVTVDGGKWIRVEYCKDMAAPVSGPLNITVSSNRSTIASSAWSSSGAMSAKLCSDPDPAYEHFQALFVTPTFHPIPGEHLVTATAVFPGAHNSDTADDSMAKTVTLE